MANKINIKTNVKKGGLISKQDFVKNFSEALKSEFENVYGLNSEKISLSTRNADIMLKAFEKSINDVFKKYDKLVLRGFLTLRIRNQKARVNIDPRNPSRKINTPAKKVIRISAGSKLKDSVK